MGDSCIFSATGVFRRVVTIFAHDWFKLSCLSSYLVFVPSGLMSLASALALPNPTETGVTVATNGHLAVWPFVAGFVTSCLGVVFSGAVFQAALAELDGRERSLSRSIETGIRLFLSNSAILLLGGLSVGLSTILFIIPGLMLVCRWFVAAPVNVAESSGVLQSSIGAVN